MVNVYESSYLLIHHDPANRLLELEWTHPVSGQQLRDGLTAGLQYAEELQIRAWIGNMKNLQTIVFPDQQWIYEEWFPRFARLGVRRLAVVELGDSGSRIGIAQIMRHTEGLTPLATAYFATAEAARGWAQHWRDEPMLPSTSFPAYPSGS
ncbi:hypothetical protein DNI29_16155 [Hymenobacter sediminis]|uniref:hypothetical protein n=1 Tax=Hymenobacter sediminis TaxID=2218621 RepID=UPI000DA6BC70|nr:hypothetical protein [Hymenobacter sediminis]RPD45690.1 hypothetical protein DNI29_16155 [Hymenobacter sediminis]